MDPYKILDIPYTSTDDEVKRAYRTLSKKYHPDANIGNPHQAEYTEKFTTIQKAYHQIMDERKRGVGGNSSYYSAGGQQNAYQQQSSYNRGNTTYKTYTDFNDFFSDFAGGGYQQQNAQQQYQSDTDRYLQAVENYIRAGYYQEAYTVLNQINEKNAKWYYYSAIVNANMRNNATALEHAQRACQMEPDNMQYRDLLSQIQSGRTNYQTRRSSYSPIMSSANCCYQIMLLNCLCQCMGSRGCPMIYFWPCL